MKAPIEVTMIFVGDTGEVTEELVPLILLAGAKRNLAEIRKTGVGYFAAPDEVAAKITKYLGVCCEVFTPSPQHPKCKAVRVVSGNTASTVGADESRVELAKSVLNFIQGSHMLDESADDLSRDINRFFGYQCEAYTPYADWPDARAVRLLECSQ